MMAIKGSVVVLATIVLLTMVSLAAGATTPPPAGTSCTTNRIRKSWDSYNSTEKTRYMNAVKLAMAKGYHQKFVELHTEWFSEREAHQTCMFIYWHRMYLLSYENMLRSLHTDYQCITLPYWDHLSATARRASGTCSSLESCSPIVGDFGGSTTGKDIDLKIYNVTISDTTSTKCVSQGLLSSFCGNNTVCAGCVLRGPAKSTAYPAEAYFASIYRQLFTYSVWSSVTKSIESGVHNIIHGSIGGIMAYFQSPIDPLFYGHHVFIDALQSIYFKCQNNGEIFLSASKKGSDPRFWSGCGRRTGGVFKNSDNITMNTRDFSGKKWVHVRTNGNNSLHAFFKDLPAKYAQYVDAKDLGVYSYTYELQGALANMYTNCNKSNTISAAGTTTTTAFLEAEENQEANNNHSHNGLRPVIKGHTKSDLQMRHWTIAMYEAARIAGYNEATAREQMELILCTLKSQCFGGVADYDPVFRKNFGVKGHPRCVTLLQQIKQGKKIIGVPSWQAISMKFLACNMKTVGALMSVVE